MINTSLVILAASSTPVCRQRVDKHLDGYYTMQYMSSGGVNLSYDDHHYILEGEWFWPAYPGPHLVFHRADSYDSWNHRHIGFSGDLVFEWIASGLWPTEPQPAPDGKDHAASFERMIAQSHRTDARGRRMTVNLLEQLLIELADSRATTAASSLPDWLQRVVAQVTTTPDCDYDAVAASEGMSASTLRRHFRRAMGMSIHKYVIRRRIESARALLVETDMPLKGIADALGYENQYFFSRQFHETVGVPPGMFRKSKQGGL